MATAKRKQEELGEECDDQEPQDNDCSDEEEAKRPRLDIHQHLHHQLPHRQWSQPGEPARSDQSAKDYYYQEYKYREDETPCDLSNWQLRGDATSGDSELNSDSVSVDDEQPINFAYYHF